MKQGKERMRGSVSNEEGREGGGGEFMRGAVKGRSDIRLFC